MAITNAKNVKTKTEGPKLSKKKTTNKKDGETNNNATDAAATRSSLRGASKRSKERKNDAGGGGKGGKMKKRPRYEEEGEDKAAEGENSRDATLSSSSSSSSLLAARPGWDTIFFFFFLTHVLITILWHSQMILPSKVYPQCLRDLTKTYSKDWQDPLNFSKKTPIWYLSIIYCEVFFQLPFHFIAIYVFWTGSHFHPWFRMPSIMYSVHVATTFMPIFAYLTSFETLIPCQNSKVQSSSCALGQTLRLKLIAVYYAPFFLIPLRLLTFSVFRTYNNPVTPSATSSARGSFDGSTAHQSQETPTPTPRDPVKSDAKNGEALVMKKTE